MSVFAALVGSYGGSQLRNNAPVEITFTRVCDLVARRHTVTTMLTIIKIVK